MKHYQPNENDTSSPEGIPDGLSRFKALISSEDITTGTIKDALFDVMKRDGQATWASVAKHLALVRQSAGELGRVRLDASIEHLRRLASNATSPPVESTTRT